MTAALPLDGLIVWMLAGVRLLAMFTVAPLFGHLAIPSRIRLCLALVIAAGVAPETELGVAALDAFSLAGLVAAEASIGLAMGMLAQLIFAAFGMFGEFISVQGGLGAAHLVDPSSGAPSVALAAGLQSFALVVYLSIGGHHLLIQGAANSFELLPIGGGPPDKRALLHVAALASVVYEVAVRLSLPVTVAMFVGNAGLGILGRAIPQLNLMTLQLPVHIAAMLLILTMGARTITHEMGSILTQWTGSIDRIVGGVP